MSTKLPPVCALLFFASFSLPIHATSTIEFASITDTLVERQAVEIYLTITPPLSQPATVTLKALGGSAIPGVDFHFITNAAPRPLPDTVVVSLPPGATTHRAAFFIAIDDGLPEGDESVTIGLGDLPPDLVLGSQSNLVLLIKNAPVTVEAGAYDFYSEAAGGQLDFWRHGDTNLAFTVDYVIEGDVTPGVDLQLPATGTVSFAIGEREKTITLDLNDGIVDASRVEMLTVRLENPTDGVGMENAAIELRIEDGQYPTTLDLSFQPDVRGWIVDVLPLAEGNVLVADQYGAEGFPPAAVWGLRILAADGSLRRDIPVRFQDFAGFAEQADGRILVAGQVEGAAPGNLLHRITLDGHLEEGFAGPTVLSGVASGSNYIVPNNDGSIYVVDPSYRLIRIKPDGQEDTGFVPVSLGDTGRLFIAADSRGRPLWNGTHRFNLDGSPDPTFQPQLPAGSLILNRPAMLANGQMLVPVDVGYVAQLIRLNEDGSIDPSFHTEPGPRDSHMAAVLPLREGGCILSWVQWGGGGRVMKLADDGTTIAAQPVWFVGAPCAPSFVAPVAGNAHHVLIFGERWSVNGLRTDSLIRVALDPPASTVVAFGDNFTGVSTEEREAVAYFRVLRQGDVTRPASIELSTRNGTANAGRDYLAMTTTLDFAPFEQWKEIEVPLVNDQELEGDESFEVVLTPLSGVDRVGPPLTVTIVDDEAGFLPNPLRRKEDGSVDLTFRWPSCCAQPVVQVSTDLRTWRNAKGTVTPVRDGVWILNDESAAQESSRFYRLLSPARAAKAGRVRPHC